QIATAQNGLGGPGQAVAILCEDSQSAHLIIPLRESNDGMAKPQLTTMPALESTAPAPAALPIGRPPGSGDRCQGRCGHLVDINAGSPTRVHSSRFFRRRAAMPSPGRVDNRV